MTAIVTLCRVATMKNAKYLAKLFVRDTSGATAIEYGLIAAAMGLMLIPRDVFAVDNRQRDIV